MLQNKYLKKLITNYYQSIKEQDTKAIPSIKANPGSDADKID